MTPSWSAERKKMSRMEISAKCDELVNLHMKEHFQLEIIARLVKLDPSLKGNAAVKAVLHRVTQRQVFIACVVCNKVPVKEWT